MILEKEYSIGIRDVEKSNLISNKGFLGILENIACCHSDIAGYGINDIPNTNFSWILLHWKVSIKKRVQYRSKITVKTWSRSLNKFSTLRDFEVYDENNNLICIASSKWVLFDVKENRIAKITDEIIKKYLPEEKSVFNENDIMKLKEIAIDSIPNYSFKVQRRDIDINNHMHNLYYLDYAYEALPDEIYQSSNFNDFEIMYKTSAKLGDKIDCYYSQNDNHHYITMKNNKTNKLISIIKFY